jgi:hypothetical protein
VVWDQASADAVILSDGSLKEMAIIWIKNHPVQFLATIINNVKNLLFENYQPLIYQRIDDFLHRWVLTSKLLLYLFFPAGTFFALLSSGFRLALVPLLVILYMTITIPLMHTDARYFVYTYLFIIITVAISSVIRGDQKKKKLDKGHGDDI